MSKPITSTNDVAEQIADEAIDQLSAAVQTIIQLEALFRACRKELGGNSDTARLIALGEYTAMDQGNSFDCTRETLRDRLNNCAPRSGIAENVARIPLAEFAKGRQHIAARELGVQQAAISKALRVGREIFVIRHADGTVTATEVRPFPCVTVEGGAK